MTERSFDDLFPTHESGGHEPRRSEYVRPTSTHVHHRASTPTYSAASPYQDRDRYRRIATAPPKRTSRIPLAIALAVLVLVALVGGGVLFVQSLPAAITLNGSSVNVGGDKTLGDALHATGIKPKPGDLVAVDGSVIEEGKGEPFHATINGEATTDTTTKLASGDVVELGDGNPIEEPSEVAEVAIPYSFEEEGNGPIHIIEGDGADGTKRTKTGTLSGLVAEEMLQNPVNPVRRNVSPEVGDDKVVALTFDDGPWSDSTAAILDTLSEFGAKATFFTVGDRINGEGVDLVKRAAAEGHQICTHTFDHAAGDGQSVNLGYMTAEDQVAEVQKGYEAIEAATGAEASHVFRTPGGNYGEDVMRNVGPLVTAEIGWNIDSQDWRRPGVGPIADQIKNAWPGAIVLMHDGGGDRSQTVQALRDALPYLKAQGYRFITMDELLSYPLS
ncbi:polysaccharide deacetylase family protein [Eggerthella sinensis]|uniref:polysaccharide deacetylase family protein n=1 Tax=Eggerthella sinensis TaxID=242230 RepID=UPI001FD021C9|nr:polysaccharide deacetylase family protein [Eggerthella sinensis]